MSYDPSSVTSRDKKHLCITSVCVPAGVDLVPPLWAVGEPGVSEGEPFIRKILLVIYVNMQF